MTLVEHVEKTGYPVTQRLLSSLVRLFTRTVHLRTAEAKFTEIFNKYGREPDAFSFGAMMSMFCVARRPDKAIEWLELMKSKGFTPWLQVYKDILRACFRGKEEALGKKTWADMRAHGYSVRDPKYFELFTSDAEKEARGRRLAEGQRREEQRLERYPSMLGRPNKGQHRRRTGDNKPS